jgi:hypothetical protein
VDHLEFLTLGHPKLISIPAAGVRLCLCENEISDSQHPEDRRLNTLHLSNEHSQGETEVLGEKPV